MPQARSPPAPVEPMSRDGFRTSPSDSEFEHFAKRDMFSQSRDVFASQQHDKSKDYYGKDSTDMGSFARNSDFGLVSVNI